MIKDNLHPNIVDDMDRPVNHTPIPGPRTIGAEPVVVEVPKSRLTRNGKIARNVGLMATGAVLTIGAQAGVHEFSDLVSHNKQVLDDYEKAHKVVTYNSPDNPNDAPDTRYSHRLPEPSPTDVPGMKPAGR